MLSEDISERLITPLEAPPEPVLLQEKNQCPGTMQKYLFRPLGYEPRTLDRSARRGQSLYEKFKCAQCHAIKRQGGELGPPLDGIGGHRGRDWLTARLLDPAKQMQDFPDIFGGKPNIMPHPGVSKKEAQSLADYLLTLPEPKAGFAVSSHAVPKDSQKRDTTPESQWQPQPQSQASQSGKELFMSMRCTACHSLDGSKDRFGPDLAGIGERVNAKRLDKTLSGAVRSSVMKQQTQTLGDEQIFDIKAFLLTLPNAAPSANAEHEKRD